MQLKKRIILTLFIGALLASCVGQAAPTDEPTPDVNVVMTAGIGTFLAGLTQTQAALPKTATPSPSPSPTWTVSPISLNSVTPPTSTQAFIIPAATIFIAPTVTGTQYTPTSNPSSLAVGCNNLRLISEEMDPSGPTVPPGETFVKTWKVENNGTCTWAYLYRFVFISGDRMDGEPSRSGNPIEPGKWTKVTVTGKAPTKPGTYVGYWRMATQAGTPFGATLALTIIVANPTATPTTASYP